MLIHLKEFNLVGVSGRLFAAISEAFPTKCRFSFKLGIFDIILPENWGKGLILKNSPSILLSYWIKLDDEID